MTHMKDLPEVDAGLVAGAEAVGGHVHDGGRLADGPAVHHGLVPVVVVVVVVVVGG